jgi:hypothetical protein
MADENTGGNSLVAIWTSGDREVAGKMVFLYTRNARPRDCPGPGARPDKRLDFPGQRC